MVYDLFLSLVYFVVSYDEFKAATEAPLGPMRVHEGTMGTLISYCYIRSHLIYLYSIHV